jgi:hypothetical protein
MVCPYGAVFKPVFIMPAHNTGSLRVNSGLKVPLFNGLAVPLFWQSWVKILAALQ